MTDATKLTFKSPLVVSIIFAAVLGTTTVLTAHFNTNNKIDKLSAKFDVYIASNISDKVIMEYRVNDLSAQVNVNTISIKTIADFIEPKRIEIKSRRR